LEDEHRKIIDLLNELQHQIANAAPVSDQRYALHLMTSYLRANCLGEERIMEDCCLPLARTHNEDHRAHFRAIHMIEANLIAGKTEDAMAALKAFCQTLTCHIRERDQEIVDWKRSYSERARSDMR
jgi:hemerythrin